MDGLGAAVAIVAIFTVIAAIIGIAFYLFTAYALYKLAQKRAIENAWLAWIPVAQMYILGQMVKKVKISNFEIPSLEIVLPVGMLAAIVLGAVPVIGWLITIAFYALLLITLYNLYNQYLPEKAMMYTVLSILGVTVPFFLLQLSKKEPVTPE
jgi:magnesium-transporting ATPase (P-type)